jgi:hypothetical protein
MSAVSSRGSIVLRRRPAGLLVPVKHKTLERLSVWRMTYHRKDRTNQAVVDKGVDAAILHHGPGVFRGWKIGFAV